MGTLSGRFGRHEIMGSLAQDERSEVYAVRAQVAGQPELRALKVILGTGETDKVLHALSREAMSFADLVHPQIAKVHDVLEVGDRVAFISDMVVGEPLKTLLHAKDEPMAPPLALAIAAEIALVVARAHAHGDEQNGRARNTLHGDLCPSNVMITHEGEIVVREFGMALAESRIDRSKKGLRGHFGYMAPERARADLDLDGRADVYSLGLILFELLTGQPAIAGSTDEDLLALALRPRIPRVSSKRKIQRAVERIVQKALAIDPKDRFGSMREMAMVLSGLRAAQLGKSELKQELSKRMARHFQHRARAMRTLMSKWLREAPRPVSDPQMRKIRPPLDSGAVRPRAPSHAEMSAALFADLDLAMEAPVEAPRGDILDSPTDDLIRNKTRDIPVPKRRLSFVQGVMLCSLLVVGLSASSLLWPESWKRAALKMAHQISRSVDGLISP